MSKQRRGTRGGLIPQGDSTQGIVSYGAFTVVDGGIRIDFAKLDQPSRIYDAEATAVRRGGGFVSLLFGKFDLDNEKQFTSRLEIKMSPEAFIVHFWENGTEFVRGLREAVDKWPKDPLLRPLNAAGVTSERSHSEWANFAVLSRSGGHGTVDFYYIPPLALANVMKGRGLQHMSATAVVRILMTIHQMYHLFEQSEAIVDEVKRYLPEEVLHG